MRDITRNFIKSFVIISCILALTACQTLDNKKRAKSFDEILYEYTKFLRWGHFREITNFMTAEHRAASQDKVDSFSNIRISSVNSTDWISDETGNRLTGTVDIKYYVEDRAVVRKTKQQLVWVYDEEGKFWLLDSGLPALDTR
ncbi:MAG: hypothetical protein EP297_12500 [Gammaproteobacteria bacterium]|nr:MAG: hypothetical protein EP297_12500 [Gammaproteobacteria bacterium]